MAGPSLEFWNPARLHALLASGVSIGLAAFALRAALRRRRARSREVALADKRLAADQAPPGTAAVAGEGAMLGRYRIEQEIGRGAMGAVFLGRDSATQRPVALKTLALGRELDGDDLALARKRFFREAETARRLRHPDIVTVLDAGEDRGLAYIAMEHLNGHDLQRHTEPAGLLPVPLVLQVVARVADALAYAHSQGVVHRDIKPANVMVDLAAGSVKVTDFGIARSIGSAPTRTGIMLGTLSFMSPEQLAGLRVDGRSDTYSLGVMLFQLLCARLPHEADSMAALMRQITEQCAPDIRTLRPQLPVALAELLARTLEKRVEMRQGDAGQLALGLREIAAGMTDAAASAAAA